MELHWTRNEQPAQEQDFDLVITVKYVRPVTDVIGSVVPCACGPVLSFSVAFSLVRAMHKVHVMSVTNKHLKKLTSRK